MGNHRPRRHEGAASWLAAAVLAFALACISTSAFGDAISGEVTSGGATSPERLRPVDMGLPLPDPEPALPPAADPFDPPRLATAPNAPAVADSLATAGPDETVTLAGGGFAAGNIRFAVFSQTAASPASFDVVDALGADAVSASFTLPRRLTWSTYLVWPEQDGRRGRPFAVNRTEAWWVGPDVAAAGATVSVFGRNLATGNGTQQSFVYIKPTGQAGQWLEPLSVDPYKVDVRVPSLQPGSYEIWVHNGHGGRFGWSGPLVLTVRAAPTDASARTFDVRSFGARGDGSTDDGAAIAKAIAAAAAQSPATLYFPAGTYVVDRVLDIPSGVRWLGEGRDQSRLTLRIPLSKLRATAFLGGGGADVTFERITIDADGRIDDAAGNMLMLNGRDIAFRQARLTSWGGMTLQAGVTRLSFDDVEVTGKGSFVGSSAQVFFRNNIFRMTDDGESAVASWGGNGLAFIGNQLFNADETRPDGNGIGRLFVSQGHFGSTRNLYFADNQTHNAAPRDCRFVDCNKGEQIIFEYGAVRLKPRASAVGPDSVTFATLTEDETRPLWHVVVAAGRGAGQARRVVAVEGNTLRLERAWTVQPDTATSLFFITPIAERAVVYRNRFQGRATYAEHDSNSTGTLVWGNCRDIVVADNDIANMRHGIMVAATSGTAEDSVSAPYFVLVTGNRIVDGNNGLYAGLTFGYDTVPPILGGIGNAFRANTIAGMSHIGIALDTWDTVGGSIHATVVEHNRLRDVRFGLASALKLIWTGLDFRPTPARGTRLAQTVLYDNSFDRGSAVAEGSFGFLSAPQQGWIGRVNLWRDFASGNGGPGAAPP
ncbi:glycosyl hydrolase family 28-related protein [Bosea sp. 117]|uniref:glycosyl hydrolase family 28-related protein n=1 Tax=Bosea sp. 117 TaxID=1125973 RepID=UPI00068C4EAC|nr:glycosyl hydrolase family 28-related protein [Bosea sp. 117]